jgi:hypothetical protein
VQLRPKDILKTKNKLMPGLTVERRTSGLQLMRSSTDHDFERKGAIWCIQFVFTPSLSKASVHVAASACVFPPSFHFSGHRRSMWPIYNSSWHSSRSHVQNSLPVLMTKGGKEFVMG